MAEQFAAQLTANPSGGTVTVVVAGQVSTVGVATGVSIAINDIGLVAKIGNRWKVVQKLVTAAPAWTPPITSPPPATTNTGTNLFSPVDTASRRGSVWRTDKLHVYQGNYSGQGNHYGCAFYGSGPASLGGATVNAASVRVKRLYGPGYLGGSNGQTTLVRYAESTRPAGAPTVQASATGPNLPQFYDEVLFTVPTAWAQALVDGTAGGLGIFVSGGSPYLATYGLADIASAWQLSISWTR